MRVNTLVFDNNGETVLVEVDPAIPRRTIKVSDSVWFLALIGDQEVELPRAEEPMGATEKAINDAGLSRVGPAARVSPRTNGQVSREEAMQSRPGWSLRHLADQKDLTIVWNAVSSGDARLDPVDARILSMRFPKEGDATPVAEVAKILGIPRSTVSRRLRRGLRAIGVSVKRETRVANGKAAVPRRGGGDRARRAWLNGMQASTVINDDPKVRSRIEQMFRDSSGDRYGLSARDFQILQYLYTWDAESHTFKKRMTQLEAGRKLGFHDKSGSGVSKILLGIVERIRKA